MADLRKKPRKNTFYLYKIVEIEVNTYDFQNFTYLQLY